MHTSTLRVVQVGSLSSLFVLVALVSSAAAQSSPPPLRIVEFSTGNAHVAPSAPTVIAIHGLGDTAANFSRVFRSANIDAHWVIPQAPTSYGRGFSWFPVRVPLDPQEDLAPGVDLAAQAINALIHYLRTERGLKGSLVITGFSQGGVISYALAVGPHAEFSLAIPIAGALPQRTPITRTSVPVTAIHGNRDRVVPIELGARAVSRIQAQGGRAQLITLPGVGHRLPTQVRKTVLNAIRALRPAAAPTGQADTRSSRP